jgi:serine/threonine protein kinase
MPLATGQILNNRYRIVKLLGQGGFGAVYRAWDMNLKCAFALKENLELSPESVRQFEREATFLAELHHPNLPRVIDCFIIPGQGQYLVMDFIEGETLEEKMAQAGGCLNESQVIPWVNQVCEALTFLHAQKPPVIHRDIKPANIKITPQGKAVLVDFGIAKTYFGQQQTTLGARAITEGYSPPEQYGHGITDARSDVYALGATLYYLFTGQVPVESVQRQLGADLVPPRSLNPLISSRTEAAIINALAIDMADRFQRADDFKAAMAAPVVVQPPASVEAYGGTLGDTLIAAPLVQPQQKPQKVGKSRKGMIIGVALGVSICILAVSLGTLGGVFAFLKGTSTPTVSPTRVTPTEAVTTATVPTETPFPVPDESEDEPTQAPAPLTPTPTLTPTPVPPTSTRTPTEESGEWHPCENTYTSRLHVGDQAYVSYFPPLNNRVRTTPDLDASQIGSLEPGEKMKIIDGPSCADNMVWWEIRSLETSLTGWTSEGDKENYWLVPLQP